MGGKLPGGEGALEQALHRGGDQAGFALRHGVEGRQPLVLPLLGGHRAVVEQEFPGADRGGGHLRQRRHVGRQPGTLRLVRAHQHHGGVQLFQQARGKMRTVDGGKARHLHRRAARLQVRG